jgi:AraC-like DNA-binding protein
MASRQLRNRLLDAARDAANDARIAEVQSAAGYSAKHFIEIFRASVGLTPKTYCRVRRFQSVLENLFGKRKIEWARVALDCGFYDQSHLNREFRAFSGVTPGEYQGVAIDRPNHLAIG